MDILTIPRKEFLSAIDNKKELTSIVIKRGHIDILVNNTPVTMKAIATENMSMDIPTNELRPLKKSRKKFIDGSTTSRGGDRISLDKLIFYGK